MYNMGEIEIITLTSTGKNPRNEPVTPFEIR